MINPLPFVIPAHAGIQCGKRKGQRLWIPAFAGMTKGREGPYSSPGLRDGSK